MNFKKLLSYIGVISIPILVGLTFGKPASKLTYLLGEIFNTRNISTQQIQYVLIGIGALICALLVCEFSLKKWIIAVVVFISAGLSILRTRQQFYFYHDHPDYGDMKNVPECMKEENFDTLWEFLNRGCHMTLGEFARGLSYKSACWIIVFFLTGFIVQRFRKKRNAKVNSELMDSIEPDES